MGVPIMPLESLIPHEKEGEPQLQTRSRKGSAGGGAAGSAGPARPGGVGGFLDGGAAVEVDDAGAGVENDELGDVFDVEKAPEPLAGVGFGGDEPASHVVGLHVFEGRGAVFVATAEDEGEGLAFGAEPVGEFDEARGEGAARGHQEAEK